MLREPLERPGPFGRRDAVRLAVAAIPIILALAAGVAGDLTPSNPGLASGTVARLAVIAPRDATITNPAKIKAAQDAASAAVTEVYDYTQTAAASIAANQVSKLQTALRPVDVAFSSTASANDRRAALQVALPAALPSLSYGDRTTLLTLDPTRWPVVESAAVTALGKGEAVEIRDVDLASKQATLAQQYLPAGLSS